MSALMPKNEKSTEEKTPSVTIVNKNRSECIDFIIICKNGEGRKEVRFGCEKVCLKTNSTFFRDMFEICSKNSTEVNQREEVQLTDDFTENVVHKALCILSGIIDKNVWTINVAADVIDFGHKYGSDGVVQCGLQKFCSAFSVEANLARNMPFNSRYEAAALVKYISLWRRMIQKDLICTIETLNMYMWCMRHLWQKWCLRCETSPGRATVACFMNLNTSKYLDSYDICLTSEYIKRIQTGTSVDFRTIIPLQSKKKRALIGEGAYE